MSPEKVSRSEVAEWEEPRHPGPASHRQSTPLPPTLQHKSRLVSHISLPRSGRGPENGIFAAGSAVGRNDLRLAGRCTALCRRCGCTPSCEIGWLREGIRPDVALRERRDQRGGNEQQDRRDEQERDDELDLRRRLGRLLGAAGGAPGARFRGLGGEGVVKWGAVALGASQCLDERGDAVGGAARLEMVQRLLGGLAELATGGGAPQLVRERAGMAAADLGERASRREARGDGDAEEIEHVGQLGVDRPAPLFGPSSEPELRRQEPGRGSEEQDRGPEPAGCGGDERERDQAAHERQARLRGDDIGHRHVESGGGDPGLETLWRIDAELRAEPGDEHGDDAPPATRAAEGEQLGDPHGRSRAGEGRGEGRGGHRVTARDRWRTATIATTWNRTARTVSQAEIGLASRRAMNPGLPSSASTAAATGMPSTSRAVKRAWAVAASASRSWRAAASSADARSRRSAGRSPPASRWSRMPATIASHSGAAARRRSRSSTASVGEPRRSAWAAARSSWPAAPLTPAATASTAPRTECPAASASASARATLGAAATSAERNRRRRARTAAIASAGPAVAATAAASIPPASQPAAPSATAANTPRRRRSGAVGRVPSRPARTTGATARASVAATRVRSTAASSSQTPRTAQTPPANASAALTPRPALFREHDVLGQRRQDGGAKPAEEPGLARSDQPAGPVQRALDRPAIRLAELPGVPERPQVDHAPALPCHVLEQLVADPREGESANRPERSRDGAQSRRPPVPQRRAPLRGAVAPRVQLARRRSSSDPHHLGDRDDAAGAVRRARLADHEIEGVGHLLADRGVRQPQGGPHGPHPHSPQRPP